MLLWCLLLMLVALWVGDVGVAVCGTKKNVCYLQRKWYGVVKYERKKRVCRLMFSFIVIFV